MQSLGPYESEELSFHQHDIIFLPCPTFLCDFNGRDIVGMNHGDDASKRHCGGCILEHPGRGFTGISLAPVFSVKSVSKFLLKNYVRAGRHLRALIPYPRQCSRRRVHLECHVAKPTAANQQSIRLAQNRERAKLQGRISLKNPFKECLRLLNRTYAAISKVPGNNWIGMNPSKK